MRREPVFVLLTQDALPVARRLQVTAGGHVHGLEGRVCDADEAFADAAAHLRSLFRDGRPIVGLMASGALIRCLAPVLGDKRTEPPVVAVAQDGSAVVPLLGGHHGANGLARKLGAALNVPAAVTTASDVVHGVALDDPPPGWRLAGSVDHKALAAALLAGDGVRATGDAADLLDWLPQGEGPTIVATAEDRTDATFHPAVLTIGVGCERDCDPGELAALVQEALGGLAPGAVAAIGSLDLKADEPAVLELGATLDRPVRFFSAATLERERPRLHNPSDVVFREVGCHGVAEGAALALAGEGAQLVVPKRKSRRATVAVARAPRPLTMLSGRPRGRLHVVGIGPGGSGWRSPEATAMLERSTDLVGYSLYLDLLGPLAERRARHDFPLGGEEDRVRFALELAGEGREVSLVCSGDAGIYAMAALVFELLDRGELSDGARRVAIEVAPGISALQAAAARVGAPLGHDFCTISLSDLLTPWPAIQKRVDAAARGDFVIAFYNPVSKRRRTQLAYARDVLLRHRPADTPVVLATNLGRHGERVRIVPLAELDVDAVDMLTVVIVGSRETRTVRQGGRIWAYTPRGYAAKPGGFGEAA